MKHRLHLFVLTAGLLSGVLPGFATGDSPAVMTVGDKVVSLDEFEYLWNKNKNISADTMTVREYADMFALFKMKVSAAEAAGIDTTASFLREWKGYRAQLTPPYLTDKASEQAAVEEAYQMAVTYVDASHILLMVKPNADPADTLQAYNEIMRIRRLALKKNADFAALAREYSQDGSKENGGSLGTTTAGHYIYAFAKPLMTLGEGEISQPVRSQFGYHLIKLHHRFEAPGKFVTGHIFKALPQGADAEASARAEKEIRAIYAELQAGADFIELAISERNDDQYPRTNGGVYPSMMPGSMPYEYEQVAYTLSDGAYSAPFRSPYGWHIIKLLVMEPLDGIETMAKDLRAMMVADERAHAGQDGLVRHLKTEYGYTADEAAFEAFCRLASSHGVADSALAAQAASLSELAAFGPERITAADFARYLSDHRLDVNNLRKAWTACVRERILAYEDSRLEEKYPSFGHLMQEYHDGLLLFEISNREVWRKASTDREGLAGYFEANRDRYTWEAPRWKGYIIYCSDKKIAAQAKRQTARMEADSIFNYLNRTYNSDTLRIVKMEKGLFGQGQHPVIDKLAFKTGDWTPDEAYPYVWLRGRMLKAPEEVLDVRGAVVADYQQYLESEWVEALRRTYAVKMDEALIETIK